MATQQNTAAKHVISSGAQRSREILTMQDAQAKKIPPLASLGRDDIVGASLGRDDIYTSCYVIVGALREAPLQ